MGKCSPDRGVSSATVPASLLLLGPQRLRPSLAPALDRLGVAGAVAVVTAGWQERELEHGELAEHLERPVVNLELYRRAEEVFAADRELFAAYRRRQDRLREIQRLYRLRLDHALAAVRELERRRGGTADLVGEARRAAMADLRRLDAEHVARVAEAHGEFVAGWGERRAAATEAHRRELAELLEGCEAVGIAGGHVAVLLNRLRLFEVDGLLGGRPLLAWSGGAMVLAERVVLFHDNPPQGAGNAEVLEAGLGRVEGLLPLPHARRRLRLEDRRRISVFARRFAPLVPVVLDDGAVLPIAGADAAGVRRVATLTVEGEVVAGWVAPRGGGEEEPGEEGEG